MLLQSIKQAEKLINNSRITLSDNADHWVKAAVNIAYKSAMPQGLTPYKDIGLPVKKLQSLLYHTAMMGYIAGTMEGKAQERAERRLKRGHSLTK